MNEHSTEIHREQNDKLTRLYVGRDLTIWYSYQTPIAFAVNGLGTFKIENEGQTTTTRKHLNSIAAHSLPREEFDKELARLMGKIETAARRIAESYQPKEGAR